MNNAVTPSPSLSFGSMAVHVGEAVERVREERGMPKTVLAERIGRTPKNLYELLTYPGWDTLLLQKASEALAFNFFKLLADDFEPAVPATDSAVSEPKVAYGKEAKGVDVTIRVDPNDPESARRFLQALKQLERK